MLKHALKYASIGWYVFPCDNRTKSPLTKSGFHDASIDEEQIIKWWTDRPDSMIGIACGKSNIVVIDIDKKDKRDGEQTWGAIKTDDITSCEQITQSGGRQIILRADETKIIKQGSDVNGYHGIDIRNHGGYIIVAPSLMASGNKYEWLTDQSPFEMKPSEIPDWVYELFKQEKNNKFKLPKDDISSGHQDETMYKFCCSLRSSDMPDDLIRDALRIQLKKCPASGKPWTEKDIDRWMNSSNKLKKENTQWDTTQGGKKKSTLRNILNIIRTDENLNNLYKYNKFTEYIEYTQKPIWGNYGDLFVDDKEIIQLRSYIGEKYEIDLGQNIAFDAVIKTAIDNVYHPVQDYFSGLKWDEKNRLDTWLTAYFGVADSEYARTVGKMTLISACARIDCPGIKYDYMLIIEGNQRIGKSMGVSVLGKQWFSEISLMDRDKDTVGKMRGKWILEVSEMEVLKKKDVESLKSFITVQSDRVRLPYERTTKDYPRQNIFIGTINPGSSGYFVDQTGNTRFFPVYATKCNISALQCDVDMLWAEAWRVYKNGYKLYLNEQKMIGLCKKEQELRLIVDEWHDNIKEWLDKPGSKKDKIRGIDIWSGCFDGKPEKFGFHEQRRISNIMLKLGYSKKPFSKDDVLVKGYVKNKEQIEWNS